MFWRKNRTGEFPAPPTPRWGPAGGALVRWCTSKVARPGAIRCVRRAGRLGSMTIPENVLRELWVGKDRGFLRFAHSYYAGIGALASSRGLGTVFALGARQELGS